MLLNDTECRSLRWRGGGARLCGGKPRHLCSLGLRHVHNLHTHTAEAQAGKSALDAVVKIG